GPSGCGKSTLLHLVGGLDRPTEGEVIMDGTSLAAMKDDDLTKLRRKRIGFVFQFYNLIPVLNAAENAALPVTLDGVKPADARKRAAEWLQRFGLGDRLASRPDQLSGGQQQRVAVARALVAEALLLASVGTAFGILSGMYLGYVIVKALGIMFPMNYSFSVSGILAGIAIGLILGAVAAIIPARQAARLQVVEALRYE
ncbi:MAG: ATP-binding cassette domain-containing protein, partial [Anaerolineales bacterium]|nr:ATP-binding cassette domain-containing protein [Anaerolineales bacterium]